MASAPPHLQRKSASPAGSVSELPDGTSRLGLVKRRKQSSRAPGFWSRREPPCGEVWRNVGLAIWLCCGVPGAISRTLIAQPPRGRHEHRLVRPIVYGPERGVGIVDLGPTEASPRASAQIRHYDRRQTAGWQRRLHRVVVLGRTSSFGLRRLLRIHVGGCRERTGETRGRVVEYRQSRDTVKPVPFCRHRMPNARSTSARLSAARTARDRGSHPAVALPFK